MDRGDPPDAEGCVSHLPMDHVMMREALTEGELPPECSSL